MIDHFGINCSDYEASKRFYDAVLGLLVHAACHARSDQEAHA